MLDVLLHEVDKERRRKFYVLPRRTDDFAEVVVEFLRYVPRRTFERHLALQDAGPDRDEVLELLNEIVDKEARGIEWRRSGPRWADEDFS